MMVVTLHAQQVQDADGLAAAAAIDGNVDGEVVLLPRHLIGMAVDSRNDNDLHLDDEEEEEDKYNDHVLNDGRQLMGKKKKKKKKKKITRKRKIKKKKLKNLLRVFLVVLLGFLDLVRHNHNHRLQQHHRLQLKYHPYPHRLYLDLLQRHH
mmetsp:Transcript_29694/g.34161  ORF Transcript_29694/g.34161 Transcript_29694/m.34161 type:complete len:151 (+) Transcript_29694:881-1333(+)